VDREVDVKAVVWRRYGAPMDVLALEDVEVPTPVEGEVVLRVVAAGVNALDWHLVTGVPWLVRLTGFGLLRPRSGRAGRDVAGVVEAVGPGVARFAVGDEVLGTCAGSLAEVAVAAEHRLVPKPPSLSFEHAAALPIAGITALEALRDVAAVRAGQRVLITGASGGVGTFAVQLAVALGAEVTAVCSGRNVELVRSLGAGEVVDYTHEDWTAGGRRYDAVIELAGRPSLAAVRRCLTDGGIHVLSGGEGGRLLGPVPRGLRAMAVAAVTRTRARLFLATERAETLAELVGFVERGELTPVIERTVAFVDAPAAVEHLRQGHTRGKTVVTI
jgi:NADPH:quinone reductase-like Zn-dependent oxidoreductase